MNIIYEKDYFTLHHHPHISHHLCQGGSEESCNWEVVGQHNEHLLHQRKLWSPHSWNRRESKCFYCFYKYQLMLSNFSVEMKSTELE